MIARALAFISLAALCGCFESSVPLGPPERVMVNPGFVGAWKCERAKGTVAVTILPYDGSRYYVESTDGKETVRYAAHASIVGGALLHSVKPLDGDKWFFVRAVSPVDSELVLSVVRGEALKDLDEAGALREIRRRVNDEALYEPWAKCRK